MIKQSAYVIALLLGTSSAAVPESVSLFADSIDDNEDLGLNIVKADQKYQYESYEKDAKLLALQDEDPSAEKVEVSEPIPNQALSNGKYGEGMEAFPNAYRTAFYVQYDEQNQLWRNMAQVQDAYGTDGATNHNPNLGVERRDPWVYEFSREIMPPFATHCQKNKKDIGEGGIDESVHTFCTEDTNVLPLPRRRRKEAYSGQGSAPNVVAGSSALVERAKHNKDIGEGGIDEEVHGVASADTHVLPLPRRRRKTAYANNGSDPKSHAQVHKHHHHHHHNKDIGEGGIDEEVHGVASADTHVLPLPRRRRKTAYANNGSHEKAHSLAEMVAAAEADECDIRNCKDVRTDVFTTVDNMIGQIPLTRRKTAPKHKFVPSKSGGGITIENNGPSGVITGGKAALAQVNDDSQPEKVHELLPLEHQNRANTNTPNRRTTFYAQDN